ncbi:hypothetical protein L195_g062864, partial [Trifolium pratense]
VAVVDAVTVAAVVANMSIALAVTRGVKSF